MSPIFNTNSIKDTYYNISDSLTVKGNENKINDLTFLLLEEGLNVKRNKDGNYDDGEHSVGNLHIDDWKSIDKDRALSTTLLELCQSENTSVDEQLDNLINIYAFIREEADKSLKIRRLYDSPVFSFSNAQSLYLNEFKKVSKSIADESYIKDCVSFFRSLTSEYLQSLSKELKFAEYKLEGEGSSIYDSQSSKFIRKRFDPTTPGLGLMKSEVFPGSPVTFTDPSKKHVGREFLKDYSNSKNIHVDTLDLYKHSLSTFPVENTVLLEKDENKLWLITLKLLNFFNLITAYIMSFIKSISSLIKNTFFKLISYLKF